MVSTLRPAALDALGLAATLRHQLEHIGEWSGLSIRFQAGAERYPKAAETALYRIVHEAVANVIKHAHARSVQVQLKTVGQHIVLVVRDDGRGFTPKETGPTPARGGRGADQHAQAGRAACTGAARCSADRAWGRWCAWRSRCGSRSHSSTGTGQRRADQWAGPEARERITAMEAISVLIADDHPIARQGLRAMLESDPQVQVVGEAAGWRPGAGDGGATEPHRGADGHQDAEPGRTGGHRRLKEQSPTTSVIMLTNHDDEALVIDAVRAGAGGYLLKDSTHELLLYTIGAVANGGILIKAPLLRKAIGSGTARHAALAPTQQAAIDSLTERERVVLQRMAEGHTNREIGDALATPR